MKATMLRFNTSTVPVPAVRLARRLLGWRVKSHRLFSVCVEDKHGLEIGGPSGVFRDTGILPLYKYAAGLDNCVYSPKTPWPWQHSGSPVFFYHRKKPVGINFILEATALANIPDDRYDFLLASHCLEHTANPVKALKEWSRVLKPGGAIIVILPHYRHTFDHRRQATPVEHMLGDYERDVDETDRTHLEEVLRFHDLSRQDEKMSFEEFRARCENNLQSRWMHHHVFDEFNSRALLEAVGLSVRNVEFVKPHHIVLLSTKGLESS